MQKQFSKDLKKKKKKNLWKILQNAQTLKSFIKYFHFKVSHHSERCRAQAQIYRQVIKFDT